MAKWLVAGGVVLAVIVLLLWLQMRPEPAPVARTAAPAAKPTQVAMAAAAPEAAAAPAVAAEKSDEAPAPAAPSGPAKLDPRSDEFFYKFDDIVPNRLTRNAAKCYEGRHGSLHRNQKLSLRFKTRISGGVVTVHDVTIKESTLKDSALETCFIQEVMRSTWKDDELPDWEQDDELVIRPERGMKKFWRENIDYVGDVAPTQ